MAIGGLQLAVHDDVDQHTLADTTALGDHDGGDSFTDDDGGALVGGPSGVAPAGMAQADVESSVLFAASPLPPTLLEPLALAELPSATSAVGNKPVTFNRGGPIKSSGYAGTGNQPWSVAQAKKKAAAKKPLKTKMEAMLPKEVPNYNTACAAPTQEMVKTSAALGRYGVHAKTPVAALTFSATGDSVLSAGADGVAHLLRFPPPVAGDGVQSTLNAHAMPLTCADVSLTRSKLTVATGSVDGSLKLWHPSKKPAALVAHTPIPGTAVKEVRAVRFFGGDRLIAVGVGGSLQLFRYALDLRHDDLDTRRNLSRVQPCLEVKPGAQSVTCVECYNYPSMVASNALLYGGSNKEIGVLDAATGTIVRRWEGAHGRPVHSLAMPTAGRFAGLPPSGLNTFASAALDGTVKLWDARAPDAPVRTLAAHSNAALKSGLALSPCGRYLAVGSEDRALFVYDVGTGAPLARLPVGELPSAVAFHPTASQLLVGTTAGQLRAFASP